MVFCWKFCVGERKWLKVTLVVVASGLTTALLLAGSVYAYYKVYENRVYPGVYVGQYHLGGMNQEEVQSFLQTLNARLAREGLDFRVLLATSTPIFKINTTLASAEAVTDIVSLDAIQLAEEGLRQGRGGGFWREVTAPLVLRLRGVRLSADVVMDDAALAQALRQELSVFEDMPHNANIIIANYPDLAFEVVPERAGKIFDLDGIKDRVRDNLSLLSFATVEITPEEFYPSIAVDDLKDIGDKITSVFGYGQLGINYVDPQSKARRDWNISADTLSEWVEVQRDSDERVVLGLSSAYVKEYLESQVRSYTDRPPQNAKFVMAEGRVKEFQGSDAGASLDIDKTYADLNKAFLDRNYRPEEAAKTISATVAVVEPKVKVSDINDLGISGIVGVGYSTFKDSHTNRIKNIANAVKRLNGLLIKPDEEFSTINSAGPFIADNGYLPEEVIKGNKIEKEIGGGMCQIGTTLFRMAMNSGMPITERRNHSLVVGYYADPVNGNPGTDATVYEPILDFKFHNDTGHYLLLQTAIDYQRQQLTFTLWGKPDGRQGWYSHPKVSRWIPAGEVQRIPTTDLAPGEEKCQNAFTGAVASFVYSRVTSAGERIDKVFESYYRPLPRICMVGEEEEQAGEEVCPEGEVCSSENDNTSATPNASSTGALE